MAVEKIYVTSNVVVRKIVVSEMKNNVYLLSHIDGSKILIDAAAEYKKILHMINIAGSGSKLDLTITTHSHWDHVRALPDIISHTNCETAAGLADIPNMSVPIDRYLIDRMKINIGGLSLLVIGLSGHTLGSVALLYDEPGSSPFLFSGDSLFPGGIGNTFKSRNNFVQLYSDVCEKIFAILPDDTIVFPGHGESTTLGKERPFLGDWKQREW